MHMKFGIPSLTSSALLGALLLAGVPAAPAHAGVFQLVEIATNIDNRQNGGNQDGDGDSEEEGDRTLQDTKPTVNVDLLEQLLRLVGLR